MAINLQPEKGIVNRGNQRRIKEVMKRAQAGEKLTLGFLGGSITQGSLSSTPETCYAYLVYEWWKKTFPNAEFVYLNAGIGGTTSQFGVARVESDLLRYKPDFVIVEFSVNDDNNEFFLETYEGLIRKIYGNVEKPAVLIVHNVCYDTGKNAEEQHLKIGKHYNIPCVGMKETIYPLVESGELPNRDITPDDLYELSFLEKRTNFGMKIVKQVKELLPERYGELEQFELLCNELQDNEQDDKEIES